MTIDISGVLERGDLLMKVDLTIAPGRTAVVGVNGSGKTSLLRLIAGLEALSTGRLTIDERVVDEPARGTFVAAHQRRAAFVFQDHRLFPHLNVVDNVAFALRRQGVRRDEARVRSLAALDELGLSHLAGAAPNSLSVGQRQRVAVARALSTPADTLLLDEPLASVDDDSRGDLRDRLTTTAHATVIWVTHEPSDADIADAVITLDRTGISQSANP